MANHQGNTMHGKGGNNPMIQGDTNAATGATINFGHLVNNPGMTSLIQTVVVQPGVNSARGANGRPIGCIMDLNSYMKELKDNTHELIVMRNDVNDIIRRGISMVQTGECQKWRDDVEVAEEEMRNIEKKFREEKKCLAGWCPNVYFCMKLGKRVEDINVRVTNLQLKREAFRGRELVAAPWEKFVHQSVQNVDTGSTTDLTLKRILESIEDVKVQKIGIFGMGGVGKTLTMKLLNNQFGTSQKFEIIIFITVSEEGNRRKVQNDIADRLKCLAPNESDDQLKATIHKFLEGKKFLLLLDDVWNQIDLPEIGIPVINQVNGCKVVLATRDCRICRLMLTNVNIEIQKLSKQEAWSLFNENVGDVAMSPQIEPIARDIVEKCCGLPLAIILIGSSLRMKKHVAVWKSMRRKLQSTSQIEILEQGLFPILRVSYDRLNKDCEKKFFLYCSLYPEDRKISITELVEYCWLEGYIEGVVSIEEARDEGCATVMSLVDASLLERGDDEEHVKMHDIIRDFALKEASKFFVKTGRHVKQPPEENEWLQSEKISLMECSLGHLLESPNCNTLSTLLLQHNYQLSMISDSFFEFMHSLRILDLSSTKIKSLPLSLWNLVELRGLYLKDCRELEELPSQVGALKGLEVLHLGGSTAIRYLPKEVENLTGLKRLIVGFKGRQSCPNDKDTEEWNMKLRVPIGIIPNLKLLEELSLSVHNCIEKEQWDDESMKHVIDKVCELEHLIYLDAYFPNEECLEHFLHHSKQLKEGKEGWFERFRFRVGVEKDANWAVYRDDQGWESEGCLVYKGGLAMSHDAIMKTLGHSSFFHLQDHHTARKLSELGLEKMNKLKECWVMGCDKMETLFEGDDQLQQEARKILPNLEMLKIEKLPELRSLCNGPLAAKSLSKLTHLKITLCKNMNKVFDGRLLPGSLSKLKHIELKGCLNLKKVFQLGIIRRLRCLESLKVSNCPAVEEIIEIEEQTSVPSIKEIQLEYLPELVSICRESSKFEWPSLETIDILECPKLMSLSFLYNGTNIVPLALKQIYGQSSWWEALEWEDNDIKQQLQPFMSAHGGKRHQLNRTG